MHALQKYPWAAVVAVMFCLLGVGAMGVGKGTASAADSSAVGPQVVINELHTNPDVKTELVEFVELYNCGTTAVDLSGWSFIEGVFYAFPAGATLPAGAYVVVAENPEALGRKFGTERVGLPGGRVFGPYGGGLDGDGERVVLCDAAGVVVDEVDYQLGFPWPTVGDAVPTSSPGLGASLQLVNPRFDNDLGGSWRSAFPSPTLANRVSSTSLSPQVRQVRHSPRQPGSGQVVTVTAKVTDEDVLDAVLLRYQTVSPGKYISRMDSQYNVAWVSIAMRDDGLAGDAEAGDDVFTAQIPATQQVHRNLVRYRIVASDSRGGITTTPYSDDPQPNFVYFVYDGVPLWQGAVQPGVTAAIDFPAEVMRSLPVYHLISKKSDVEDCTWLSKYAGSDYLWYGTLVYDGEVYDHVRYRARGGVWRYAMGKNMVKVDFQRGHYFQARDDYGNPYDTKWAKLNLSACIQQGSFGQRGEQGMFEAVSFRMFNLAGCPASKTNYIHFRIIDEAFEDGTRNTAHSPITAQGTQYDGDFWGLYLTIEQLDGQFLDEHELPDGNLFKIEGGGTLNNQGPTQPTNGSDLSAFTSAYRGNASAEWWQQNVNLDAYYAYYAVYQAIHHGDITEKNWFLYHHPETNQWWQLPWDLDLTWTTYYGSNDPSDAFSRSGVLNQSVISIANKNRLREVVDLLFNTDQANQLIDEYAAIINDPAGGLSLVDADQCMWDYHWAVGNAAYPTYINQPASSKAGQGKFYQEAVRRGYERTFEGMVSVMKDYVVERVEYLNGKAADAAIPNTPIIASSAPAGFPANALTFTAAPFADPQGAGTFSAMKWRLAEVSAGSQAPIEDGAGAITLLGDNSTWRYFKGMTEPSAVQGAWRQLGFDDSAWLSGQAAIGFGETFLGTTLADMRGNYSSLYLRKTFDVTSLDLFDRLVLNVKYDDGVNVWINGRLVYSDNVSAENLPCTTLAAGSIENIDFVAYDLGDPRDRLVQGRNVIAVQVLNSSLSGSSDCFIDVSLSGEKSQDVTLPGQPVTPRIVRREPGRYEIEAAWESDEIKTFASDVTIPATAVRPGRTYRVRCRMKDDTGRWSKWSGPVQFVAGEPVAAGILADLRITELMYHPPEIDTGAESEGFEFIELKNVGDETLDLSSVSFDKGVTFDFAAGAVKSLGPGQFVLVVKNKQAFFSRYGQALSGLVAGEYGGKLANDGEGVSLVDTWNGTIAEFEYGDGRGWPLSADGGGHSLVPQDGALLDEPKGSLNYPGNWRASTYLAGSPGRDDPAPVASVLINELLAESDVSDDWVELYNPTDASVNLAGWFLSDDRGDLSKWAIPAGSIPAHGYAAFDLGGFGLSRGGEELLLSHLPGTAESRIADAVQFKAQEPDVSLGRYPDGGDYWFRLTPSPGEANANPISDVVIDELMYHPVDPNEEYVELYNPLNQKIDLGAGGGWRLDGAVDFNFPAETSIPAGGRVVVVGFDPEVETSRLIAFLVAYKISPSAGNMEVVGPWSGSLSNRGERVALEKSLPDGNSPDSAAWVVVDEVIYSDVAPWPVGADGDGQALQRLATDPGHSGNDPTNWQVAAPTPGK